MTTVNISRIYQNDCTVGMLNIGEDWRCFTLELPDKDNQRNVSCIPDGIYLCEKYNSPTHGECVAILNVPSRSDIRIHSGNFTRQILGCILVGDSVRDIDKDGIPDVTNSKATMKKMMAQLPSKFELIIS